jgi:hypothetical protein
VRSDSHNAEPVTRLAAHLSIFEEEVHTALRPIHPSLATSKEVLSTYALFQIGHKFIKSL